VAVERARRAGVPCVLTSPCPSLEALAWGSLLTPDRAVERHGWPVVDIVDMRREDPRTGLLPEPLVRVLRSDRRVLCVLNRTGRARLLACAACRELVRCERCDANVTQPGDELACTRCGATRPIVCLHCGGTKLRALRQGVTRVRDEIAALVREPVDEVTGARPAGEAPRSRVVVGTEATLHQIASADVVVFLDIDQELLAPRYRAAEQALGLVARAARLVGGRAGGGRLLIQTHVPGHEVVQAALHGDPTRVSDAESERRELLRFPPVTAMAEISGAAAPDFVAALAARSPDPLLPPTAPSSPAPAPASPATPAGVELLGPADGRWLVRAADHRALCDTLAAVPRPAGRLRVAVDPPRI
jgi:primosomal protein N' (replication factor Y)